MEDLLLAIESGDYPTVSTILGKQETYDTVTEVLEIGCEIGDNRLVKIGLQNITGNIQHIEKKYLLHRVCCNGYSSIAALLLENGAQVDLLENGWPALILASQKGYFEVVKVLLENGAQVNFQRGGGWSALMTASENGHVEVARILIEHKALVDLQRANGASALIIASQNGHAEVVKTLLENQAEVNLQDEDGYSALMIASSKGHAEVVQLLLENKAACQSDHFEVAKLQLQNGAKVDLLTEEGLSA